GGAPEQDGSQLGLLVLQREVDVACGAAADRRQLPGHPHPSHLLVQQATHAGGELRHREDARPAGCAEHRARAAHSPLTCGSCAAHSARWATFVRCTCPLCSTSSARSSCWSLPSSPSFTFAVAASESSSVLSSTSALAPVSLALSPPGCSRCRGRFASRSSGDESPFACCLPPWSITTSGSIPLAWMDRP